MLKSLITTTTAAIAATLLLFFSWATSATAQLNTDSIEQSIERTTPETPGRVTGPSQIGVDPADRISIYEQVEQRFRLRGVNITGNTFLSKTELSQLALPYVGQNITVDQLKQFVANINQYLINRGFLTVRAFLPEQRVQDGVVGVEIVEGKLGEVRVIGANYHDPAAIRDEFSELMDQVVKVEELDQLLIRLNRNPNINPKANVVQLETGVFAIEIDLQEQPRHFVSVSLDNYGARSLGRQQMRLTYAFRNLTGNDDNITLSALASEEGGTTYLKADYDLHFASTGGSMNVSASKTTSKINEVAIKEITENNRNSLVGFQPFSILEAIPGQDTVTQYDVDYPRVFAQLDEQNASTEVMALHYEHPVILNSREQLIAQVGIEVRNAESEIRSTSKLATGPNGELIDSVDDFLDEINDPQARETLRQSILAATRTERDEEVSFEDKSRSFKLGVRYSPTLLEDRFSFQLEYQQGIEGFGSSTREDVEKSETSRSEAYPDFKLFRLNGTYQTAFPRNLLLTANFSSQFALNRLFPGYRFSPAGAGGVRGYGVSEELGDSGWMINANLSKALMPGLAAFVFRDYAHLESKEYELTDGVYVPSEVAILHSVGFGAQYLHSSGVTARMEYALSTGEVPDPTNVNNPDEDEGIFYGRLAYTF